VRDLGSDGPRSRSRLHRLEDPRALQKLRDVAAARPQLQRPPQDLLGPVSIAPAEQHLAERPVHLTITGSELPRVDQ
jgi:hypothetical protein